MFRTTGDSHPPPPPPSVAVGRSPKYQVVKSGMCDVLQKVSSQGTDRELRAGFPFTLQTWRRLAGGRNNHRCPVICHLAGAASCPRMGPTGRYRPEPTPGPGSTAGYLGASGRSGMRWTMWVATTSPRATWPQPHETPFKFLEHAKHLPVSGPASAQGVPSASGSLPRHISGPRHLTSLLRKAFLPKGPPRPPRGILHTATCLFLSRCLS